MLLMHADEKSANALREKWAAESKLKETKVEVKQMQNVSTSWLEDRVSTKLFEIQEQKAKAADDAERQRKQAIKTADDELRRQLGQDFIDRAGARIHNGQASFAYKGKQYIVRMEEGEMWLSFDETKTKINRNIPGNASERIIVTLAQAEDF